MKAQVPKTRESETRQSPEQISEKRESTERVSETRELPQHVTESVDWLDEESKEAIHWHAFWQVFSPVTAYGRAAKGQLKPLLPGLEHDAELCWQRLREDRLHWSESDIGTIRDQLARLPDIRDTVSMLTWSTAPLTPKHFLALKQFAVRGLHLALSQTVRKAPWSDPGDFVPLVEVFMKEPGSTGTFGEADSVGSTALYEAASAASEQFSVEDLDSKLYTAAQQAVTAAMQRVTAAKRQQNQLWTALTSSKLRADGHLVLPLPHERQLAEACKQDNRLKWLRDTPYESIFEVLPDEDLANAKAAFERAKEQLEVEEQRLFTLLTNRIRDTLNVWERAITAVTELDIRTAKVHMLRLMHGCVPEFGTQVELTDGVHLEAAERLTKIGGHAFTPVTLLPEDGVNILFGANMGGKTMSLSVLTASQILAQYGLPVPARSFRTRLFSSIRFAATSGTDLHSGLSAYGAEVVRVSTCWEALVQRPPALTVFDEPVRSTNPVEGAALVTGLVRALNERTAGTQSVVFLATHYADPLHEPTVAKFRVRGLKRDVGGKPGLPIDSHGHDAHTSLGTKGTEQTREEDRLMQLEAAMDYQIERVNESSIQQEALPVAEFLGAPDEWLKYARQYLREGSKP